MKVLECLDFNWDCQIKLKYIMKKFNNLKKKSSWNNERKISKTAKKQRKHV